MVVDRVTAVWAEMDEEGTPSNPWGIKAHRLAIKTDLPMEACRDGVILEYLMQGETLPLAALLNLGAAPASEVLRYLGIMMVPELRPKGFTEKQTPFGLKVCNISEIKSTAPKGKKGKSHPFTEDRNDLIADYFRKTMKESCYQAAEAELMELTGLKRATVANAYNAKYGKKRNAK